MADELIKEQNEGTCGKGRPQGELDILFGAWTAGLGLIILLLGLSIWTRATIGDTSEDDKSDLPLADVN